MLSPTAFWKSLQGWAERNWPLLSALGYALAFAVMLGGIALAAYTAGFGGPVLSLAFGGLVIWLVKLYARGVRAMQRLIHRLHPADANDDAAPGALPGWASVVYILIGLALAYWVGAHEDVYTYAAIELFVGWAAGQNVLEYYFAHQNNPAAPSAFAIIDEALDRLVEPHRPLLRTINTALGFVALSGSVALHAGNSGFARVAALSYTGSDAAATQVAIALLCGTIAILFTRLYIAITLGAQQALIDPWRYVRPEPPSRDIERWPLFLFAAIGIALFLTMSFIGQEEAADSSTFLVKSESFKLEIGTLGLLALFVGWGCGGYVVLRHFWAKSRARAERAHVRA